MKRLCAIAVVAVLAGCGPGLVESDALSDAIQRSAEQPSDGDGDDTPGDIPPTTMPTTPTDDEPAADNDLPPVASERIPVFIAQGHMQRTVMSCDGGLSWVANRSADDQARCWVDDDPHYVECDHNSGAGRGLTFTGTAFVATFGWGYGGGIYRSVDGVTWTASVLGTSFGGINTGAGKVVALSAEPRVSDDDGVSFDAIPGEEIANSARRTGFVAYGSGRFIMVGDGVISLSSDAGVTWWAPDVWPSGCGDSIQTEGGVAYGNGVILVLGGNGLACRSLDGGDTWTTHATGNDWMQSQMVWTGSAFRSWSEGKAYSSPDGAMWSSVSTVPADLEIGTVAYDPDNGIYAAVSRAQYEGQHFYRSVDGVNWQELAPDKIVGSHTTRAMVFGYAARSTVCP